MPIWDVNRIRSVEDIVRFHEDLKKRLSGVSGFAQLQGLKNQSDQLCYLLTLPRYAERFGNRIGEARRIALLENAELARLATEVARKHEWNRRFRSWADMLHVSLPVGTEQQATGEQGAGAAAETAPMPGEPEGGETKASC